MARGWELIAKVFMSTKFHHGDRKLIEVRFLYLCEPREFDEVVEFWMKKFLSAFEGDENENSRSQSRKSQSS